MPGVVLEVIGDELSIGFWVSALDVVHTLVRSTTLCESLRLGDCNLGASADYSKINFLGGPIINEFSESDLVVMSVGLPRIWSLSSVALVHLTGHCNVSAKSLVVSYDFTS